MRNDTVFWFGMGAGMMAGMALGMMMPAGRTPMKTQVGKRIQKVHIKGFKREGNQLNWVSLLKSESDWQAVMDAFKEVGYEGYLTAELSVDERGLEGMAEDIDALCAM